MVVLVGTPTHCRILFLSVMKTMDQSHRFILDRFALLLSQSKFRSVIVGHLVLGSQNLCSKVDIKNPWQNALDNKKSDRGYWVRGFEGGLSTQICYRGNSRTSH